MILIKCINFELLKVVVQHDEHCVIVGEVVSGGNCGWSAGGYQSKIIGCLPTREIYSHCCNAMQTSVLSRRGTRSTTKSLNSEVKKACMMLVAFFVPSVSQDVVALLKKLQIPAGDGGGGGCVRQSALPKKFFAATWMDI